MIAVADEKSRSVINKTMGESPGKSLSKKIARCRLCGEWLVAVSMTCMCIWKDVSR